MEDKYRLQFFDRENTVLAIGWSARKGKPYTSGDCRVRAIMENTNIEQHNRDNFQSHNYSEPMTVEEARNYIEINSQMLGQIHDCVGLKLEDIAKSVDFDNPIEIRNLD